MYVCMHVCMQEDKKRSTRLKALFLHINLNDHKYCSNHPMPPGCTKSILFFSRANG